MKKRYSLSIFIISLFISGMLYSQQSNHRDWRKLHYLSKKEMNEPVNFGRNFTPTDPPEGFVRNVSEFDQMQAVLVRYPFGVPVSLIQEMAENDTVITIVANASEQNTVTGIYQSNGVNLNHCKFLYAQTDSYWVRDYGPWFVFDGDLNPGIVDFPYNRPRPNDNNIPSAVAAYLGIDLYGMNLTHTGGNYMCSGMGQAASTNLVYDENPSYSHAQIDTIVKDYLGIETYHVTIDPLAEYIKHIDCWAKFLAPDKILIGQVLPTDPRYDNFEMVATYYANQTSSWGDKYKVYRVFTPGTSPDTPYTNSLILNNKVYVPTTGSEWDSDALTVYQEAMPGYQIIGVQYSGWINTDALHCRTKGVADLKMLYIWHVPLLGNVPYQESYDLEANIYNASGQSIYSDSALIYYKVNEGNWQTTSLSHQYDYYWDGSLSGFVPGDTVRYYLFAADRSGRRSFQPRMAGADPHLFVVGRWEGAQISFNPDTVWFQNETQMTEGIPLTIVNVSPDTAQILDITQYGTAFPWFIDSLPTFPKTLPPHDTLMVTVFCSFVVNTPESLLTDYMYVSTADSIYSELLMVDSNLIDDNLNKQKPELSVQCLVHPNPFSNKVIFEINLGNSTQATLDIYTTSGKLILNKHLQTASGKTELQLNQSDFVHLPQSNGILFYRLTAGEKTVSGKLLFVN